MNNDRITPSFNELKVIIESNLSSESESKPNLFPIYKKIRYSFLTVSQAYLKLAQLNDRRPSFLFESTLHGETIGRYSFIGIKPKKVIRTGDIPSKYPKEYCNVDPITILEKELNKYNQYQLPDLPELSGGAIGYISYDCIKYFEPKTKKPLKDVLQVPEAVFLFCDLIIVFDHLYQNFQIINNIEISGIDDINKKFIICKQEIEEIEKILTDDSYKHIKLIQQPIISNQPFTSNIGKAGYEKHVSILKEHIVKGNIIQAVPSQRIKRPTSLHPFNIYRELRTVNPSPYLFYIDLIDFQIIGASPELLVKSDGNNKIITHPIAGTIKRGLTKESDENNAKWLKSSLKDNAEHIMLVDLARNDVNRVCIPSTCNVEKFSKVERFSHVMHLVSEVSGILRDDKTRFDAFRSIFPAGTVSGAPKVRAMQLIGDLEKEKRGVYAGAIGHWCYDGKSMDTCIALRTIVYKDNVAYLQAGGGIVYDSVESDEYDETINKIAANKNTILAAEDYWKEKVGYII